MKTFSIARLKELKVVQAARKMTVDSVAFTARHGQRAIQDTHNVDICLSILCRPESLVELRFPVAYVDFLRSCLENTYCSVKEVKRKHGIGKHSDQFSVLLDIISSALPPVEFNVASAIGLVAD